MHTRGAIAPEASKKLRKPLSLVEFLRRVSLWATLMCFSRFKCKYFSQQNLASALGSFKVHYIMTRTRFEDVVSNLQCAKNDAPNFTEKFYDVREIMIALSTYVKDNFSPSWASYLYE